MVDLAQAHLDELTVNRIRSGFPVRSALDPIFRSQSGTCQVMSWYRYGFKMAEWGM